jgi:hypothetical protein
VLMLWICSVVVGIVQCFGVLIGSRYFFNLNL